MAGVRVRVISFPNVGHRSHTLSTLIGRIAHSHAMTETRMGSRQRECVDGNTYGTHDTGENPRSSALKRHATSFRQREGDSAALRSALWCFAGSPDAYISQSKAFTGKGDVVTPYPTQVTHSSFYCQHAETRRPHRAHRGAPGNPGARSCSALLASNRTRRYGELSHGIMLNTSRLGRNLPSCRPRRPRETAHTWHRAGGLVSFWAKFARMPPPPHRIGKQLGIQDWYSLHLRSSCSGMFTPNATAIGAEYNVTSCTELSSTGMRSYTILSFC